MILYILGSKIESSSYYIINKFEEKLEVLDIT